MTLKLYLASTSPRRKALLEQLGLNFAVLNVDVIEQRKSHEVAADYVRRLSLEKAQAGVDIAPLSLPVLGADTIVVCDGEVLEKPNNFIESKNMLMRLSGRMHQVLTAVTFANKAHHVTALVSTEVHFKSLSLPEIEEYWQSGEPKDKAGSYAIQGKGGRFVTHIQGSYHAVVGLPLYETERLFYEFVGLFSEKNE